MLQFLRRSSSTYDTQQQAGTGPSRRHIQGSSILFYSTRKSKTFRKKIFSKKLHTQKNGPSGAPGPASASPWRAKRGTLPKLSTFLSQLKGDPSEKKQIFEKISQCRKTERGTLWGFSTSILPQNIKKLKRGKFYFRKKISQCRKKL